jgi:hypothetical protein
MLETKILEVRDKATFIPIIATRMVSNDLTDKKELYLLGRAGYRNSNGFPPVLLTKAVGGYEAQVDPYAWNCRTLQTAHLHIEKNFGEIQNGDVVDVEWILGESESPKMSERYIESLLT